MEQVKSELRQNFEKAVSAYLSAFLKQMGFDACYGHWVGNDVTDAYCYGDDLFLSLSDIILCVDEKIMDEELYEWWYYNDWAADIGQSRINLRSWHRGYRGIPRKTMNKLSKMKQDFEEACAKAKENF